LTLLNQQGRKNRGKQCCSITACAEKFAYIDVLVYQRKKKQENIETIAKKMRKIGTELYNEEKQRNSTSCVSHKEKSVYSVVK
jgi:hypothetical protein